jgi:O-acetyl-ADP-ribose deacetylase (regulator of RNase III)
MPITLTKGDITEVAADAIVNAANSLLVIGGGVSGAIHRVGGPTIADECRAWTDEHGQVPPGDAVITGAGDLPARHVIHVVGPMWHGGDSGEPEQLEASYRSAMELADQRGLRNIAFPSLATGIFGYPVDQAAPLAIRTVRDSLTQTRGLSDVTFVLFDDDTFAQYQSALDSYANGQAP